MTVSGKSARKTVGGISQESVLQGDTRATFADLCKRASHPPLKDRAFWVVQGMVVVLAGLHFLGDLDISSVGNIFPTSVPIELLLIPIGYAAIRYGLSGSVATSIWAALAWLPDLALPNEEGHPINDITELSLIVAAAIFVGIRVEREFLEHEQAVQAKQNFHEAETRYRELFEANSSPIILVRQDGIIVGANHAAMSVFRNQLISQDVAIIFGVANQSIMKSNQKLSIKVSSEGDYERDYKLLVSELTSNDPKVDSVRQIVFQDVTQESRERAFAAMLITAQEEERMRIAREIHDEPLQTLIHLSRKAELILNESEEDIKHGEFSWLRQDILGVVSQLRSVAKGLRPAGLDQLGLIAAIRGLIADIEDECESKINFTVKGVEQRLGAEVELGVFRIIQEALNNSIRHSSANTIRIQLEFSAEAIKVQVIDDGIGFERDRVNYGGSLHMGLMGIDERASLLGGGVEVISTPKAGTKVFATIPLESIS